MPDSNYSDGDHSFFNRIDDAIGPYADGIEAIEISFQLFPLPGIRAQPLEGREHSLPIALWKLCVLPFCASFEDDDVHCVQQHAPAAQDLPGKLFPALAWPYGYPS